MAAAEELHFLLVPLAAQGHIIPMVEVGRLLAARGARVTVVTTPVNAARNRAAVEGARREGVEIELTEVAFPGREFGLPDGVENMDQLVDLAMYQAFFKAFWSMEAALEEYVRALPRRPDCLVADACNPWTAPVCDRLGIPRLVMHCPSAYFLLAVHCLAKHGVYDRVVDHLEPFEVPAFPVRAVGNKATFHGFFKWPGAEKFDHDVDEAEATADGLLINTFRDIEGVFVDAYAAALGRTTWAIGPTCAARLDAEASASRGNRADVDAGRIVSWLDARPPESVLYVSFGSLAHLRPKQVIELALGLEASGRPFIWAIKEAKLAAVSEWLDGEGYEERVGDRGLLVRGWAPQVTILSHPAAGGFVTHCGWNATLEAISHGVPTLTWPIFSDQFSSERLLVDVLGVGVRSGVKVPTLFLPAEAEGVHVASADVVKVVTELMDGGAEGAARRARAKEFAAKATAAVEEGGSSHADLTDMIGYISELSTKKQLGEKSTNNTEADAALSVVPS
ncbi:UDP-glycosyltransferase 73C1-like [Oryza brachyantha]|uniref:UDP-glycosyltransferase 73C1-like n=1 Tax=Oryza brachyantha TaxID=4533 RepID=UPI001AD9B522|nr:UDP-glycosyltransferase 73C1-like [Oryza brachyantha]